MPLDRYSDDLAQIMHLKGEHFEIVFCGGTNQRGVASTVFKGLLNLRYEADDGGKVDFRNSRLESASIKVEPLYPKEERLDQDGNKTPV